MVDTDLATLEQDLQVAMGQIHDSLPKGSADLHIGCTSDGGLAISLTPASKKSATIRLYAKNGDPNPILWIGKKTPIELPPFGNEPVEALRRIANAVLSGRFSEEIWEVNDRITKVIGRLVLDAGTAEYMYVSGGSLFRRATRRVIQYRDYLAPQVD